MKMAIRKGKVSDYYELVNLYRSFFKTHNIFQQSDKKIISYLKEQSKENELLVYDEKGSILGALYPVNLGQNADGTHKLWKFRHFAFYSDDIAEKLLEEAEKKVRKSSKTSKIELTIAETEQGIGFYKAHGYKKEAALRNHYRWGETCFTLSKSFRR